MIKLQKYIKLVIVFSLALLLGALLVWRTRTRTFEDITGMNRLAVDNMVGDVQYWEYIPRENSMDFVIHELRTDSEEHIQSVWDILDSTAYRASFRNLGSIKTGVGSDKEDGPFTCVVFMDGTNKRALYVYYHSTEMISISGSDSGYEIYYPTDKEVRDKLVNYIMRYGAER